MSVAIALDLDLEGNDTTESNALVASGGKLPFSFEVPTSKLLDVMVALIPKCRDLDTKQKRKARKVLNQKLYTKTRPGFYLEVTDVFHLAYAGQPKGAGNQHQWRIFCAESISGQIEALIAGTALTVSQPPVEHEVGGNYTKEWGGLYLRSEAEIRIAQALDRKGVLFFANARGRVGLQDAVVSDDQLTGRVEADFMVFSQGRCIVLEVDGQHHSAQDQTIRDYARDRVLLKAGVPTVRFTAKDCWKRPDEVVSEFLSILAQKM